LKWQEGVVDDVVDERESCSGATTFRHHGNNGRSVKILGRDSCGLLPMVETQQTSETLVTDDRSVARCGVGSTEQGEQQAIVPTLVGPFVLMMGDILGDGMGKRGLAEEDHAVQAFLLDRAYEPLGEGVQIGAMKRGWS
jgi:hypothetical protein